MKFTLLGLVCVAVVVYASVGRIDAEVFRSRPVKQHKAKAEKQEESKKQKRAREAWNFFNGPIRSFDITIDGENYEYLKRDGRRYAECSIKVGEQVFENVSIKIKGSAGSTQGIEQKPGLTLNFDRLKGSRLFYGQEKIHLNNCAQDATYLHEIMGGEVARAAGVPASRCTHAFVKINGRDCGTYVVKEGFTREFLDYFFTDTDGGLYDGGFVREIGADLEKDMGDKNSRDDLKAFVAAFAEKDAAKRTQLISQVLNVDAYCRFSAMEAVLGHWDGYNFNRNNFRIYAEEKSKRFYFFLHGMDQIFNDPNFPIFRDFGTMVGSVVKTSEGQALYRKHLDDIYFNVLKSTDWSARAVEIGNKLRDAMSEKNADQGKNYQAQINNVRDQIANRITAIGKMLGDTPPPFQFGPDGVAKIDAKNWRTEGSAAAADEVTVDNRATFHLRADGETNGSWRKSLNLPAGKYRLECDLKTSAVAAAKGESGEGAGLRVSGASRHDQNAASGDNNWKSVAYEFESNGNDTVLVAELRATKGEVWFDKGTLRIRKLK